MKKVFLVLCAVMLVFGVAGSAGAAVLTFDDVPGADPSALTMIPDGYGGLDWDNMYVIHEDYNPDSGYEHGVVSGEWVAFNSWGYAAYAVADTDFNFIGAYLTSAWRDGQSVTVQGFLGAAVLYDSTVVVDADAPTWCEFNYMGIDRLGFSSAFMLPFVMDNMTVTVPDASMMGLLGSSLIGLVGFGRKFKK